MIYTYLILVLQIINSYEPMRADLIGIALLALISGSIIVPKSIKNRFIEAANEIIRRYPKGAWKCNCFKTSDYESAKRILEKEGEIINAQLAYEAEQRKYKEEQRKKEEAYRISNKADEIRRSCPYAAKDKADLYLVQHEAEIRQKEERYKKKKSRAEQICHLYPEGVSKLIGYVSSWSLSYDDELINKILDNEYKIIEEQKQHDRNKAEVDALSPQLNELRSKFPLAIKALSVQNSWNLNLAADIRKLLDIKYTLPNIEEQESERLTRDIESYNNIVQNRYKLYKNRYVGKEIEFNQLLKRQYGRLADKIFASCMNLDKLDKYSLFFDKIEEQQNELSLLSCSIARRFRSFTYPINYRRRNNQGETLDGKIQISQLFYAGFCYEEGVDYTHCTSYKEKRQTVENFIRKESIYKDFVYDYVITYLEKLTSKCGDNLVVVIADSGQDKYLEFHDYHLQYFISQLNFKNISYEYLNNFKGKPAGIYFIFELITRNENIIYNVQKIMDRTIRKYTIDNYDSKEEVAKIIYCSMLKEYSRNEISEVIDAEVKKENARKEKEKEELLRQKKLEQERLHDIEEAKSLINKYRTIINQHFDYISTIDLDYDTAKTILTKKNILEKHMRLLQKVDNWDRISYDLPHKYYKDYYSYTENKSNQGSGMWDTWQLVWHFKNDPDARKPVMEFQHEAALNTVINKVKNTLTNTFGQDVSNLTLVCVCASSAYKNNLRYRDFSTRLCEELNMYNGFNYITVTKDSLPKHLHKDRNNGPEKSYDEKFFRGKFIVIFDDVTTSGQSLMKEKNKLESIGGHVICSITIAKTK